MGSIFLNWQQNKLAELCIRSKAQQDYKKPINEYITKTVFLKRDVEKIKSKEACAVL